MKCYYDPQNNRLVYVECQANEDYWDNHWKKQNVISLYKPKVPKFNFVVNITKKYLPRGSLILEGGAGLAHNSWYLHLAGYRTIALDFAQKTVMFLKQHRPEVCLLLGDVRDLPLKDESVDGYWSLGVIEHFYEGYGVILSEMHRAIKKGGYLFLTFPHMSKLRKTKAKRGLYKEWTENRDLIVDFYQFALDENQVSRKLENYGFKLIHKRYVAGLKGLKDEIRYGKNLLQDIYKGESLKTRLIKKALDVLLSPWSSHMIFLVFKKQSDGGAL